MCRDGWVVDATTGIQFMLPRREHTVVQYVTNSVSREAVATATLPVRRTIARFNAEKSEARTARRAYSFLHFSLGKVFTALLWFMEAAVCILLGAISRYFDQARTVTTSPNSLWELTPGNLVSLPPQIFQYAAYVSPWLQAAFGALFVFQFLFSWRASGAWLRGSFRATFLGFLLLYNLSAAIVVISALRFNWLHWAAVGGAIAFMGIFTLYYTLACRSFRSLVVTLVPALLFGPALWSTTRIHFAGCWIRFPVRLELEEESANNAGESTAKGSNTRQMLVILVVSAAVNAALVQLDAHVFSWRLSLQTMAAGVVLTTFALYFIYRFLGMLAYAFSRGDDGVSTPRMIAAAPSKSAVVPMLSPHRSPAKANESRHAMGSDRRRRLSGQSMRSARSFRKSPTRGMRTHQTGKVAREDDFDDDDDRSVGRRTRKRDLARNNSRHPGGDKGMSRHNTGRNGNGASHRELARHTTSSMQGQKAAMSHRTLVPHTTAGRSGVVVGEVVDGPGSAYNQRRSDAESPPMPDEVSSVTPSGTAPAQAVNGNDIVNQILEQATGGALDRIHRNARANSRQSNGPPAPDTALWERSVTTPRLRVSSQASSAFGEPPRTPGTSRLRTQFHFSGEERSSGASGGQTQGQHSLAPAIVEVSEEDQSMDDLLNDAELTSCRVVGL